VHASAHLTLAFPAKPTHTPTSPQSTPTNRQINVNVTGAEYLSYWAENGDCNATTELPLYSSWTEAWKLTANTSTKIEFVCGFRNASTVPLSVTFIGHTAARGKGLGCCGLVPVFSWFCWDVDLQSCE